MTQSILNRLRENVICRLSYYYLEGLTYKKDIPIANEYFILSAGRIRNSRRVSRRNNVNSVSLLNLTQAVSSYNLTYTTSNIISQPQTRNTSFGTRGQSRAQNVEISRTPTSVATPSPTTPTPTTAAPATTISPTTGGGGSYGY